MTSEIFTTEAFIEGPGMVFFIFAMFGLVFIIASMPTFFKGDKKNYTVAGWILAIGVALVLSGMVGDTIYQNQFDKAQEEQVSIELMESGFPSIIEIDVSNTGEDTRFTHLHENGVRECELIGTNNEREFAVFCQEKEK